MADHPTGERARQRRVAENERLIRETNWERSVEAADGGAADDEEMELWCACGRTDCSTVLSLTLREYRTAHAHPHRFVVAPGHAVDALEIVVERHRHYDVAEKRLAYQGVDPTDP